MGVIFDTIIKLSESAAIKQPHELSFDLEWEKTRKEKDLSMKTLTLILTHEMG